jgi:plastocyanin
VLVAGLSTENKIALAVMAGIFITFALVSAFVAPGRNPDFPGRGAKVYYVACFVLFFLMIGAVERYGRESEPAAERGVGNTEAKFPVSETEWKVQLPASAEKTLVPGKYVFEVKNDGKVAHNLTVSGPNVNDAHTQNLNPGQSASLRVRLYTGTYHLYCSIPGHRQAGMDTTVTVA